MGDSKPIRSPFVCPFGDEKVARVSVLRVVVAFHARHSASFRGASLFLNQHHIGRRRETHSDPDCPPPPPRKRDVSPGKTSPAARLTDLESASLYRRSVLPGGWLELVAQRLCLPFTGNLIKGANVATGSGRASSLLNSPAALSAPQRSDLGGLCGKARSPRRGGLRLPSFSPAVSLCPSAPSFFRLSAKPRGLQIAC